MPTHQYSSRSLPAKASAEYLRKEAKRFAKSRGINLVAAQRALAHEYGHRNWADLMAGAKTVLHSAHTLIGLVSKPREGAAELHDKEWSSILRLAEASLAEMQTAPGQQEWLDNRKSFAASGGTQLHFVATLGKQIVGYACAEHPPAWMRNKSGSTGEYRLFMVVEPSARSTLGNRLLAKLRESLNTLGARRAWFQEYEADSGLISFLEEKGFVRAISFRIEDGTRLVRLSMDSPFEPLIEHADHPPEPRSGK